MFDPDPFHGLFEAVEFPNDRDAGSPQFLSIHPLGNLVNRAPSRAGLKDSTAQEVKLGTAVRIPPRSYGLGAQQDLPTVLAKGLDGLLCHVGVFPRPELLPHYNANASFEVAKEPLLIVPYCK